MLNSALRHALHFLEPIGFLWGCLVVLTVVLYRRQQRRLAAALGGLVLLMWLIGATPLPGRVLASLERPWVGVSRAALPTADAVMLLGGYMAPSREEVGQIHFNQSADRAVMALELMRLEKAKTLVLSGNGMRFENLELVEPEMFKAVLEERKLIGPEIVSLGGCKHTRHEAEKLATLARERGWKRILLVTSATHMRRAAAVFRTTTGLEIVPVPCSFLTQASIYGYDSIDLVPQTPGFTKLDNYVHEQVGWWVYRWRGWISAEEAAK